MMYLPAVAVASSLGLGKRATIGPLFAGRRVPGAEIAGLPDLATSRNNRLLAALLDEIAPEIAAAKARYGAGRIAIVLGTSTSGIGDGETALAERLRTGTWPSSYRYAFQEMGDPAAFAAGHLGLTGPAYVVATACSSSAKAFASARRLIRQGLADAAIVGGADTLCGLTRAGFGALEASSAKPCNPFSVNRDGITLGEGGAVFLMCPEPGGIALAGIGESSDAHHLSAPDPEGAGALAAMRAALDDAGMAPEAVGYLNLHGTATPLNDAMESKAVNCLFGAELPCSSTKAMTGHTLGAAGAVEAAFAWLTLSSAWNPERRLPPHLWDGERDPALAPLTFATADHRLERPAILSNSFAFGGSNCSLILTS
jgi:3-oxoacyl-[acyl-carrier-protein] synthase-1